MRCAVPKIDLLPKRADSNIPPMSAIARAPKTFNNGLVLKWGLWRRKMGLVLGLPKRRVFGAILKLTMPDETAIPVREPEWLFSLCCRCGFDFKQ